MNRLLLLLVVLVLSLGSNTSLAANQICDGAMKKECKRVVKKLTKEGWQVFGSKETLAATLERHYQSMADSMGTMMTIIGRGTGANREAAKRHAEIDASKQYASMISTTVSAVTSIDLDNTTVNGHATTHQQTHLGTRTSTQQLVSGLKPTVCLSRSAGNEEVEVMVYYLISRQ